MHWLYQKSHTQNLSETFFMRSDWFTFYSIQATFVRMSTDGGLLVATALVADLVTGCRATRIISDVNNRVTVETVLTIQRFLCGRRDLPEEQQVVVLDERPMPNGDYVRRIARFNPALRMCRVIDQCECHHTPQCNPDTLRRLMHEFRNCK